MSNLTPRINRLESNLVIDGGMEIWPEGTSRSVANNTSAYGSVLMKLFNNNTGVSLTNSRQSSVPSNTNLQFSNQVSKTAAGTLAANTYVVTDYYVEGYDTAPILNNEFTVIFWVRSSVAATRTCTLRNTGSTHSFLKSYTINAANTWELKAVRFNALNTCPGSINRTNGLGCTISFPVVAGSTFQNATPNQWLTGEFLTLSGQDTTWLTGTTHDFSIAGVMVLPGNWEGLTTAQYQFVRAGRGFAEENAFVSRYVKRLAHVPVVVGNTNVFQAYYPFDIPMRTGPTIGLAGGTQLNIQGTNGYNVTATPTFSQGIGSAEGLYTQITGFTVALSQGYALVAAVPVNNGVYILADARF